MTMEKKATLNEDVSPTKNGDFPASHVSFQGCISKDLTQKKRHEIHPLGPEA